MCLIVANREHTHKALIVAPGQAVGLSMVWPEMKQAQEAENFLSTFHLRPHHSAIACPGATINIVRDCIIVA